MTDYMDEIINQQEEEELLEFKDGQGLDEIDNI